MQHVADREPGVAHLERRRLEARAAARLARRDDVRQERHLGDDRPLALARRAPRRRRSPRVEREARRPCSRASSPRAATAKSFRISSQTPRNVAGTRARRAPDRRLIDGERALHDLRAPVSAVVRARLGRDELERAPQRRVEDVAHERGLARAAHAGDDAHAPDGHAEGRRLAGCCARAPDELDPRVGHRALRALDARASPASARAVGERGSASTARRRPLGDDVAAVAAAAGAEVDEVIGGADRLGVVLDDEHGRAHVDERAQVREEAPRVARVQADGRLVEHVERAGEAAAELRAEAQALHLAAGERAPPGGRARGSRGRPARRTRGAAASSACGALRDLARRRPSKRHARARASALDDGRAPSASAYVSPRRRTPRGTARGACRRTRVHVSCGASSSIASGRPRRPCPRRPRTAPASC